MSQTVVFVWLVWISLITGVMDIVTVIIDEYRVLPFLYYLYLFTATGKDKDTWSWKDKLVLYAATAIYMAATMTVVVKYRSVLTGWQKTSVYFYLLASLTGIILQVLFPNVLLLQFAVSLALLLLYMSLESPDDDEDKQLRTLQITFRSGRRWDWIPDVSCF